MSTTSFTVRLRSKNDNVPTMDSEEETQNTKGSTGSSKAHDFRFNSGDRNGRANAKVPDDEIGYQHRSCTQSTSDVISFNRLPWNFTMFTEMAFLSHPSLQMREKKYQHRS
mmetsp:Transcript_9215/g.13353  ORF Transcript_9215/g.13353 Transcript_9215/m.13353 type:complete len:111 (+) Transcript_9215:5204-5536(+)